MHQKRFKLSTVIILFVCLVVLLSLIITDILISNTVNEDIRSHQEEKAKIVSRTVAKSHIVIEGLEVEKEGPNRIQDFTRDIQAATNVMFVVVMDMNGIRKSHPNPNEIGKHFVGGDEVEVLKGHEHLSSSKGTLGESLRAFTPIYNSKQEQIGAVAVGISLDDVEKALYRSHRNIITGTIIGLVVGIFGAMVLAKYIKRILLGLEPFSIAKILEERNIMLQSVHEGIVAVDNQSIITLVNKSALRIFQKAGLSEHPIGMKITDFMPSSRLDCVLKTGNPELDEEQNINGVSILVNRVPLVVNGHVLGAISTFRDKTEVNQLAEQLTGVRMYAEALRAQSHEFMNRLHVILGMVRMEFHDELSDYISKIVDYRNQEYGSISKNIKDPALAGFMMGKLSFAREENVDLTISNETVIPKPENPNITHELITIIGNLIDNAIEAMSDMNDKILEVNLRYSSRILSIEVSDSGPGIPEGTIGKILEKGYSTKGYDRGYGLYLVSSSIQKLGGVMTIESKYMEGTDFYIEIPYVPKEEKND